MAVDYAGHVPEELPAEWCGVPAEEHTDHRDEKGRVLVEHKSDRELLEETVTTLRNITDGIEQLSDMAKTNPMMKGLLGL